MTIADSFLYMTSTMKISFSFFMGFHLRVPNCFYYAPLSLLLAFMYKFAFDANQHSPKILFNENTSQTMIIVSFLLHTTITSVFLKCTKSRFKSEFEPIMFPSYRISLLQLLILTNEFVNTINHQRLNQLQCIR